MFDLISQLSQRPYGFDLFQAISLLERAYPQYKPVGQSLGWDESLRLRAQVDLAFAPSDLRALVTSQQPGPPLTLVTGVMSLAGGQGPLPACWTEMLLARGTHKDRSGLDFLDIFNQRLLAFLYRSRRKHHLSLGSGQSEGAPLMRVLDALSGLGRAEGARGPQGQSAWLRHAGLQGAAPRSMVSLLALLRDRLDVHFLGRQFEGAWQVFTIPARLSCVPARALGQGLALGRRAWDQSAGLELSTPALSPASFRSLLPGGAAHRLLGWLVARHQPADTRVVLRAAVDQLPETPLSVRAPWPLRLGLSTWLRGPVQAGRLTVGLQSPRFLVTLDARAHAN